MDFYAARQPILDREKKLFAYELLFRDSVDNVFPDMDGDEATRQMIEANKFNAGINKFTANKPAFINFTLETMSQGYPAMLAPDEVVIEVLETVKPGKKLLALCKDLFEKGYTLALDDYEHLHVWQHFYPFIKIIKIDWQITPLDKVKEIKKAITDFPHIELLAEKVETHEEYDQAVELGCAYFQGFFFAKPEVVKTKGLSPSQMAMAELLYETSKTELDLESITKIFERDIPLSYKLLRYANSPIFKRRSEISTIKQALVMLGSAELKRFLSLMFTTNVNPDKPTELILSAMVRAKFCELISDAIASHIDSSIAFLTGLLSLIDAILDEKIDVILEDLPLSQDIKDTLIKREDEMATVIKLLELVEYADWEKASVLMQELVLPTERVHADYNKALEWADEQSNLMNQAE